MSYREVTYDEAKVQQPLFVMFKAACDQVGLDYIEVSAQQNINVQKAVLLIAQKCVERAKEIKSSTTPKKDPLPCVTM